MAFNSVLLLSPRRCPAELFVSSTSWLSVLILAWHAQSLGIFSQLSREIVRLRGHKKLQVPLLLMELFFFPYRGAGFANCYRSSYQQKRCYYAKYQLKQLRISKDCSKALFGLFYLIKKIGEATKFFVLFCCNHSLYLNRINFSYNYFNQSKELRWRHRIVLCK